jgi:hypothetical protein
MSSDAAARKRALDPTRSFIVQAPAGSGKTELLTQRYLRLLATVEHPEQILAITFTRKAAAEMRNRILLAIAAAAGPAPDSPHKRTTWELARAVRAADSEHHWRLTEHPSRLRIQTIDALNSTLARRLPILAGTGSALEPAEDPRPLYETAARRLIERLGEGSEVAEHLESLIVHLGNRTDLLAQLLCDLLAKRDQWLHQIVSASAHHNLREVLERTLQGVIRRHLATLCGMMSEPRRREFWKLTVFAAENLRDAAGLNEEKRLLLAACSDAGIVPGEESRSMDAWLALASVFLKRDGTPYQTVSKRSGFPTTHPAEKERMLELLAELAQDGDLVAHLAALRNLPRPHYSQEQWRILEALLAVLPVAVAELQLVFQSQGQADYIEAALRALQALGSSEEPTDLALAFDYRLQHLLVDEFQDTSFGQLDLLERLTAGWTPGDGRTLFCVGDPMHLSLPAGGGRPVPAAAAAWLAQRAARTADAHFQLPLHASHHRMGQPRVPQRAVADGQRRAWGGALQPQCRGAAQHARWRQGSSFVRERRAGRSSTSCKAGSQEPGRRSGLHGRGSRHGETSRGIDRKRAARSVHRLPGHRDRGAAGSTGRAGSHRPDASAAAPGRQNVVARGVAGALVRADAARPARDHRQRPYIDGERVVEPGDGLE